MQLYIRLNLERPLSLPLAHHHILQGAIYSLGVDDEDPNGNNLHDSGAFAGNREYKLFCYSTLEGPHSVDNGRIEFYHYVSFEVRSVDDEWLATVEKNAFEKGVRIGGEVYDVAFVHRGVSVILSDHISFETASPITVHRTDPNTRRTKYYSPEDKEFAELISQNFMRKYNAHTGESVRADFAIECVRPRDLKMYKTWYKNFCIIGWMGKFTISGDPMYLSFLYETGIGARNSQGFGMMKIID